MEEKIQDKTSSSTRRIVRNTMLLYFRQILILLVSLYTVRVVLSELGAEDYGIYNVVAGVVTMFSFLSGAMASATQRFFSYALGEGDQGRLDRIFCVNLVVYAGIAVFAILLLETAGLWFVQNKLNIPFGRQEAGIAIFHLAVLSFVCSIFSSPFIAIIIAHEDMQLYACISVVDTVMKLLLVFVLGWVSFDKLIVYGALLSFVSLASTGIYIIVCTRRYRECQFRSFHWDSRLFREIYAFTGWSLFGQLTTVGRTQAVTVLINQMFSPLVVASRSVAVQVSSAANILATNFNTSLYPAIIKEYAAGDRQKMFSLLFRGCRLSFFLIWIVALPLFVEMEFVLELWLGSPPQAAVLFTRLTLVEVVVNTVCLPLGTAARAPGRMREYELSLGSIQLCIFIADFILFRFFHAPAYVVYIVAAVGNLLMLVVRLILVRWLLGFPATQFVVQVLARILVAAGLSGCASWYVASVLPDTFVWVVLGGLLSVLFSCLALWSVGFGREERLFVMRKIKGRFARQ